MMARCRECRSGTTTVHPGPSESGPPPFRPQPRFRSKFIKAGVADRFPKEYIEAVISEAMLILPAYKDRQDTLVVINPRRLAIILDEPMSRGVAAPGRADRASHRGPEAGQAGAMALTCPSSRFYVMHIAGSWFEGR